MAGDLLELLGAEVVRVDVVHGPAHAARIAAMEPIAAIDAVGAFDEPPFAVVRLAPLDAPAAWAASGALFLTGPADTAPIAPDPQVAMRLLAVGAVVQLLAACREVVLDLDPLAALGERAALAGFGRNGATSVGGNAHLVRAADGWVALNLARADDIASLPALLDGDVAPHTAWPEVRAAIARRSRATLERRAGLLGLPLGAVPDNARPRTAVRSPYVFGDATRATRSSGSPALRATSTADHGRPASRTPLVVDLSSLWAGPLAASLLGACGARVLKVEGAHRPDGARRGPPAFFDLLNHGKECVALDFTAPADVDLLRRLVEQADVVIEGSRPRVMLELGVDPFEIARDHDTTWLAITGYGRTGDDANRVGFGDDAAAAAGLVVGDPPNFVADAVADPITALYAAAAGLAALVGRRGQVIDVSLRQCAAYVRGDGDHDAFAWAGTVGAPHARLVSGPAAAHGEHTTRVRAEFGAPSSVRP